MTRRLRNKNRRPDPRSALHRRPEKEQLDTASHHRDYSFPQPAPICRRAKDTNGEPFRVRRLELFGSAVGGGFSPDRSDLDFTVEFEPLPEGGYADTFFGFKHALESLFGIPVDLVVPSAIRNPYFRQSIEKCKALLYAA